MTDARSPRDWYVIIAGRRWDDVTGTDREVAAVLAERADVLWVDPPRPLRPGTDRLGRRGCIQHVEEHVHRLQPVAHPAAGRSPWRRLSSSSLRGQVARALVQHRIRPVATIVMTPEADFPSTDCGTRVFFVTEDWAAGARLAGASPRRLTARMTDLAQRSDLIVAVSQRLADTIRFLPEHASAVEVIPSGGHVRGLPGDGARESVVGLVGQLDDRIDYAMLAAVADRGIALRLIGRRETHDPAARDALDHLLGRGNVEWVNPVDSAELAEQLSRISVGLTPYAETEFNFASVPLCTLEYLGAGIPVVSSDLPAVRSLRTEHVQIARRPTEFADRVEQLLRRPRSKAAERARQQLVSRRTWSHQVDRLVDLIAEHGPAGPGSHR